MQLAELLPILILIAAFYLLILRPARNRQRAQQRLLAQLQTGSEVMTTSGLFGTISRIEDDVVHLEVAPGTVLRVAKPSVGRVVTSTDTPDTVAPDADDPHRDGNTDDDAATDPTGPQR